MASSEITLEAVPSVSDIRAAEWDACANPLVLATVAADSCVNSKPAYNPFVSHAFFSACEASGSATARTGWAPRHLIAKVGGTVVGIVPCYLKSHSQGEYVFDRGWADAYERAGGRYYPKLQASVPFTPATGPRLLIRGGIDQDQIGTALASGLVALCGVSKASSAHVTFAREAEWKFLGQHGFPQGDQARAARGRRQRNYNPLPDRQRHHRRRLGRILRFLHGDRFAQVGTSVFDALILCAGRRDHG